MKVASFAAAILWYVMSAGAVNVMGQDAASDYAKADAKLNEVYRAAINQPVPKKTKNLLRRYQHAWIALRDGNAAFVASRYPNDPNARSLQLSTDTVRQTELIRGWFSGSKSFPGFQKSPPLAEADKKLNVTYQAVLATLSSTQKESLRVSQRAWIEYRDRGHEAMSGYGKLLSKSSSRMWLSEMTVARTQVLEGFASATPMIETPGDRSASGKLTEVSSAEPGYTMKNAPPASTRIVPVVTGVTGYGNVAIDMEEGLVMATAGGAVDFWDVQTGSLIRRITKDVTGAYAMHNLGGGYLVTAAQSRVVSTQQWFQKNSDGPLVDINPGGYRGPLMYCVAGDMTNVDLGLVAFLKSGSQLVLGSTEGNWRCFQQDDLHGSSAWAISRDGSSIMIARDFGVVLTTYSLEDGSVIGECNLPAGSSSAFGIGATETNDEFVVLNEKCELLRFHSTEGFINKIGEGVTVSDQDKEAHQFWVGWLCTTEAGWNVYGSTTRVFAKDGSGHSGIVSETKACSNAPEMVHQLVARWKNAHDVSIDRKGEFAAVIEANGQIALYHLGTGRIVQRFGVSPEEVISRDLTESTNTPNEGAYVESVIEEQISVKAASGSARGTEGRKFEIETVGVGSDRMGVVKDPVSGAEVVRVSLANYDDTVQVAAVHLETGRVALTSGHGQGVILSSLDNQSAVEPAWMNLGEAYITDVVFDAEGKKAVAALSNKFWGELHMLDLENPGKVLWKKEEIGREHLTFSPDGNLLLVYDTIAGTDNNSLWMFDALTGKEFAIRKVDGSCVGISEDTTRAYVNSTEGGLKIVSAINREFREVVRYLQGPKGSFALTLPTGHYLTHGNALDLISFSSGGRSQPAEAYDVVYNRPDLVAEALGANPEVVQGLRRAYEKRLQRLGIQEADLQGEVIPPGMEINYSSIPITTSESKVRIPIESVPGSSPLVALEVAVNDVPIFGRRGKTLAEDQSNGFSEDIEVELGQGENKITVWARDAKGLTSSRASVNVVNQSASTQPPTLFVVSIGINDYVGDDFDLDLAANDATDMASVLEGSGSSGSAKVETLLITDQSATRAGILDQVGPFLQEAGVDDKVVLFMAGHGVLDTDYEYRFCCADLDVDRIPETTLTYDEIEGLFDACLSRKRVVLLDTCHAGEADRDDERLASVGVVPNENVRSVPFQPVLVDGVGSGKRSVTDLLDRHFVDLRIGIGASVLASSSAHQAALELHGAENGLFTGTMLEGLRSGNADLDGDGSIRVSELLNFCRDSVKTVSGGLQEPVARHSNLSEDFPVLLLNQ